MTIVIDVGHNGAYDEEWTHEDEHTDITKKSKLNSEWMLKHLLNFRRWDWSYNFSLFADSLMETGRNMLEQDRFVKSEKQGRRCLHAAAMLKKIADDKLISDCDTGLSRRLENTGIAFVDIDGSEYSRLEWVYNSSNSMGMNQDEYENKMFKLAHDKEDKIKEGLINDTFELIRKNFRRWWD